MGYPPVEFPDAAAVAKSVIESYLADDTPVVGRVPNPRPDSFVTIVRSGGPKANMVSDAATLTVDCWAATDIDAHDLAQRVRAALNAATGTVAEGVTIYRVDEAGGPQLLADPASAHPRYRQLFTFPTRGTTPS